jgi:outer membrane protein assembly factor BamB
MRSLCSSGFFVVTCLALLVSCSKTPLSTTPVTPTDTLLPAGPVIIAEPAKPAGYFYVDSYGIFSKISVADSSIALTIYHKSVFGSSGSAMVMDSATIVAGSSDAISAYRKVDGRELWTFSWLMYSRALLYREPVIKDSLVFYTTGSDAGMSFAMLHCIEKGSGRRKWVARIDESSSQTTFNSTPVVIGDKVILITQDNNTRIRLSAYQVADGKQLWSTLAQNKMGQRLETFNGWVYAFRPFGLTCYRSDNGGLEWDLPQSVDYVDGTSIFTEQGEARLVQLSDKRHKVFTLNPADGRPSLLAEFPASTTDKRLIGCIYRRNKLIITSQSTTDSLVVRCYDLQTAALSWEKRFKNGVYKDDFTQATPVLAGDFFLFPAIEDRVAGKYKNTMYLMNFDGKVLQQIPFESSVITERFAYEEKGAYYNQDNRLIRPY